MKQKSDKNQETEKRDGGLKRKTGKKMVSDKTVIVRVVYCTSVYCDSATHRCQNTYDFVMICDVITLVSNGEKKLNPNER